MVTSIFNLILQELSKTRLFATVSNLQANLQNTCLIPLPDGLEIQLELDRHEKNLLVISIIGQLLPGQYRDSVFKEALIANGAPLPRCGIFAFSKKTNQLVLFSAIDLREVNGNKVEEFLLPFLEKVKVWKQALEQGSIPSPSSYALIPIKSTINDTLNIFNIK